LPSTAAPSKTHLALVARDGELLRLVRGPESQPHNVGFARALEVLDGLYAKAGGTGAADVAQLNMAGVDFPTEEEELRDAIEARGWAERTEVGNDTFAVLRAGTERGWGVAVVCGTGINCVGVSADGRHVRFPALGQITGDWGGGTDVGYAALYAAARSEDGRGPKDDARTAVPAHFGSRRRSSSRRRCIADGIRARRVLELPAGRFRRGRARPGRSEIVDRLSAEIVAMARVALERLELAGEPAEVLARRGSPPDGQRPPEAARSSRAAAESPPRSWSRRRARRRSSARRCSAGRDRRVAGAQRRLRRS
jgi:hypothetical protein